MWQIIDVTTDSGEPAKPKPYKIRTSVL